jgi:hypothetical protein
MEKDNATPCFSLFGGPLDRLGRRLNLIRGDNAFWLGVALGLLTWGVMASLALLAGFGRRFFSLDVVAVHVRLLVVIPLLFACETFVFPRMAEFIREIVNAGMVPETEMAALAEDIRRAVRRSRSWVVEAVFALVAFTLPLFVELPGRSANGGGLPGETGGHLSPVLIWHLGFCLPLFRFLLLRWVWRLGLWCGFLCRLQKRKLRLMPTHPDGVGGAGYVEVVHEHFTPLAFAISAGYAASFAEDIVSGAAAFESLYRTVPMILLLVAVLFVGPLFIFSPSLWKCRIRGWREYMGMASRYTEAFDMRWLRDGKAAGEPQLGTPDLQSLADLTNSVDVVRNMQVAPISRRLLTQLAAAAALPLSPLLFLKYPVRDVALRMLNALTGL